MLEIYDIDYICKISLFKCSKKLFFVIFDYYDNIF